MQMDSYTKDWRISRKEPSERFDRIEQGMTELIIKLDEKIGKLTVEMGHSADWFRQWLSAIRTRASAVILHCGELIHEESLPLRAILVTQNDMDTWQLKIAHKKTEMPLVDPAVCSIERMEALSIKSQIGSRILRSLLSSELLVLWNGDPDHFETTVAGARAIFEKRPVSDLAELLARDVKGIALTGSDLKEVDFSRRKKKYMKKLGNEEFETIALRAMRMRRVPKDSHDRMLSEVRKAVSR